MQRIPVSLLVCASSFDACTHHGFTYISLGNAVPHLCSQTWHWTPFTIMILTFVCKFTDIIIMASHWDCMPAPDQVKPDCTMPTGFRLTHDTLHTKPKCMVSASTVCPLSMAKTNMMGLSLHAGVPSCTSVAARRSCRLSLGSTTC